jgi:hypothetical protein
MKIRRATVGRCAPRGPTRARLRAAKAALKRERETLPLLAEQVSCEQETPEARIARADALAVGYQQSHRDLAAKHWRWARRVLVEQPDVVRKAILARWNQSTVPADAHYFADFVRTELKRCGIVAPN